MSGTGDLYSRQYARHFAARRAMARSNAEAERQREAERKAAGQPSYINRFEAALAETEGNLKRALEIIAEQDARQTA